MAREGQRAKSEPSCSQSCLLLSIFFFRLDHNILPPLTGNAADYFLGLRVFPTDGSVHRLYSMMKKTKINGKIAEITYMEQQKTFSQRTLKLV